MWQIIIDNYRQLTLVGPAGWAGCY